MKLSQTRIAIVLAVLVVTSSGCGIINRIRAKNELNEAARTYREGHFEEAEQHSRRALELDPNSKSAPSFIARTIHAQYRPGVNSPENIAKAQEAIQAYQQILQKDPKNEEAYKAIAYLYGATKDEDKLRSWIASRANDTSVEPEKRAEAYIVLASKDWDCSFKITELPANKTTTLNEGNRASVAYKKPTDQKEFDAAQACLKRGLEEIENAIKLDPNSEAAWSYNTNLLLEAKKLAEMDGKTEQAAELDKQREVAQKRTMALSEANQKKKEAEEAKQAASPAKS
jgi:tetratricopeptide (TPR) repeat protein